jgi:hypothetical protein
MPAIERGVDGEYPEGSVNQLVQTHLAELADHRAKFGAAAGGER